MKIGQISYAGLNQDMNVQDPRRNQFYYEGQNITISFNRELSQNVVSTERGNKLLLTLPNVLFIPFVYGSDPAWVTYGNDLLYTEDTTITSIAEFNPSGVILTHPNATSTTTAINDIGTNTIQWSYYGPQFDDAFVSQPGPTVASQIILGGTFLKDKLIIVSTDGDNKGHLLVWEVTYNNDYEPTIYLKYFAAGVNMNAAYPITKIQTLYENESIQKVYFTDGLNQFRTVNLSHSLPFYRNGKTIDATPEWEYSSPLVSQSLNKGGRWTMGAATAQYGYRLFTKYGPATKLSPLSNIAPIVHNNRGVGTNEFGNNTLKVTISNLDLNYENIEVYRFLNDDSGSVFCYLIHQGDVKQSSLEIYDMGNPSEISRISDISGLKFGISGPYIPVTFEYKDNRVFLGNIKETNLNIDYDARAYSFDNITTGNQEATLTGELTIDGTNPSWPTSETLNAINPTVLADFSSTNYDKYRFQSNGYIEGGSGPNVSFTFQRDVVNKDYLKFPENYWKACYKLGEVYRFGVQFFDKYGNPSFVSWIADIRMPELMRSNFPTLGPGTIYDNDSFGLTYPKFYLNNLNTLPEDIKYFRIVRANREISDRRILSQGYLNSTLYSNSGGVGSGVTSTRVNYHKGALMPYYGLARYQALTNSNFIQGEFPIIDEDVYNSDGIGIATEVDSELSSGGAGRYIKKSSYLNFYLPELIYNISNQIEPSILNKIRIVAGASGTGNSQAFEYSSSSGGFGYKELTTYTDIYNYNSAYFTATGIFTGGIETRHTFTHYKASKLWTTYHSQNTSLPTGSYVVNATYDIQETSRMGTDIGLDTLATMTGNNPYINTMVAWGTIGGAVALTDSERLGVIAKGCQTYLFSIGQNLNSVLNTLTKKKIVDVEANVSGGVTTTSAAFILAEYININVNPYGGNTYAQRQNTNYIPCTSLVEITSNSASNIVAYGGDTFPQLFKFLLLDYNDDATGNYNANLDPDFYTEYSAAGITLEQDVQDLQSIKAFASLPVETYYNLHLVDSTNDPNIHKIPESTYTKMPSYNKVYNSANTYDLAFSKGLNFKGVLVFETMTRYSDVKINNQIMDNLCQFRPNNFNDVDSTLGAITAMHLFNNNVFVVQEYGTGVWLINPNAVTSTSVGPTTLGTCSILHDYRIISDAYGSTYKFGSIAGTRGIYVLDMSKGKFVRISDSATPLSDLQGLHGKLRSLQKTITDNMYFSGTGIRLHYDPVTYNVYVSIYYDADDAGNPGDVIDINGPLPS